MELQQLRYFLSIAKQHSFTKAAKKTNVTQSTLSHAINSLEKELNCPLFDRSSRNVTLTPYGSVLMEHISPAINLIDNGSKKIHDMIDPESGIATIGNLSSLNALVTYAVSGYYIQSGNYFSKFRFFTATNYELDSMLANGGCDLALTMLDDDINVEYYPIGPIDTVIAVGKNAPLSRYKEIHLRELRNERIVGYESCTKIRSYHNELFHNNGFEPHVVFESVNDNVILSAVGMGVGVALLPMPLEPIPENICIVRILDDIPERIVALARNKNRYLPKSAENFSNYLKKNSKLLCDFLKSKNQH